MDTRFAPWTPGGLDKQVLWDAALSEAEEKHKKQLMARPYLATSRGGRDHLLFKRRREVEAIRTRVFDVLNADKRIDTFFLELSADGQREVQASIAEAAAASLWSDGSHLPHVPATNAQAEAGLVKALFDLQVARNLVMLAKELIDAESARQREAASRAVADHNADPTVQAARRASAEQLFREAVKLRERDELEGWLIICFGLAMVVTFLFVFVM